MDAERIIIGGGPAGLAKAFWHKRQHPEQRVLVLEARSRIGGWVHSERREGFLCENGPQAIRPAESFDQLVAALGVQDRLAAASQLASTRWIGRGGKLLAVPSGPLSALRSRLLTFGGKLRLLREAKVAARKQGEPEGMAAFCARRFGPETVPLVQAMVGGVFGGDAARLEVASAFPTLAELENEHGSVMRGMRARRKAKRAAGPKPKGPALVTFGGGMSELCQHLADAIGDDLRCDAPVERVRRDDDGWTVSMCDGTQLRAEQVTMACPAHVTARLLAEEAPQLCSELAAIPFASLASVYLGVPMASPQKNLQGFGFLLSDQPDNPVLGAIYVSQIFPGHAPVGQLLLRVMIGGARHPDAVDFDDAKLIESALQTVSQHTGATIEPSFTHVVRCRSAIPQYELGHDTRLQRITTMLTDLPGLDLCGNSYKGVAVTAQLGSDAGLATPVITTEAEVALS